MFFFELLFSYVSLAISFFVPLTNLFSIIPFSYLLITRDSQDEGEASFNSISTEKQSKNHFTTQEPLRILKPTSGSTGRPVLISTLELGIYNLHVPLHLDHRSLFHLVDAQSSQESIPFLFREANPQVDCNRTSSSPLRTNPSLPDEMGGTPSSPRSRAVSIASAPE